MDPTTVQQLLAIPDDAVAKLELIMSSPMAKEMGDKYAIGLYVDLLNFLHLFAEAVENGAAFEDILGQKLNFLVEIDEKDTYFRQDAFIWIYSRLMHERHSAFPFTDPSLSKLFQTISRNAEEPKTIRALAGYLWAVHLASFSPPGVQETRDTCATAKAIFQQSKTHCEEVVASGWPLLSSSLVIPVDTVLEIIMVDSSNRMISIDTSIQFLQHLLECEESPYSQPEAALEAMRMSTGASCAFEPMGAEDIYHHPPTLTSSILAEIKALPEVEQTFLIYKGTASEYEVPSTSILETAKPATADRLRNGVEYFVYKVDIKKVLAGECTKVFLRVAQLVCHKESSHQKNLLSSLVLACQQPYQPFPFKKGKKFFPPKRPQQVLFESVEDMNHPQVQMFLTMMGFADIAAAEPSMLELLKQRKTNPEVEYFLECTTSKEEMPHVHDIGKGIKCGNCGLVGPKLRKCSCGKAYYCGIECQKIQWKAHKKEHKKATANLKKKTKK